MKITRVLAAGTVALALTACAGPGYDNRRHGYDDRPAVSGKTGGMVSGPVFGGAAGSAIGSPYDRRDAERHRRPPQEGIDYPWLH